jgi:cytochrome bd-type quinol oxidase subunit 2
MNGKRLIGWMLVVGIILVVAMIFAEPAGTSDGAANPGEAITNIVNSANQYKASGVLGLVGFVTMLFGLSYYARRNQGEAQPDVVNMASSLALLALPLMAAAVALSSGITYAEMAPVAESLYQITELLFMGMISLVGLSFFLLAVGLFGRQATLLLKASWSVVALIGLSLVFTSTGLFSSGGAGDGDGGVFVMVVDMLAFLGTPIVFIVLGVRTIRSSE